MKTIRSLLKTTKQFNKLPQTSLISKRFIYTSNSTDAFSQQSESATMRDANERVLNDMNTKSERANDIKEARTEEMLQDEDSIKFFNEKQPDNRKIGEKISDKNKDFLEHARSDDIGTGTMKSPARKTQ
ncbi:hypothetical protein ABK040_013535 [Willaertia magna]